MALKNLLTEVRPPATETAFIKPSPSIVPGLDAFLDDEETSLTDINPALPDLAGLLVRAVFEETASPVLMRGLNSASQALCVCLGVPDATWEMPLRAALNGYARSVRLLFRDAASTRAIEGSTVEAMLRALHLGGVVVCASQDLKAIPAEFRSVADATFDLRAPSPNVLADVIGYLDAGRRPTDVPIDLGWGLTLREILACLRADEPAGKTVKRLTRAAKAKPVVTAIDAGPRLEDLAGYGVAAAWGQRLREDLAAYKAGTLAWHRLDSRAILHGPPGTGKTLFSSALARTLGVECIQTSVGTWFSKNAGDLGPVIKAAGQAFEEARSAVRRQGAVVLFLDEIDSLPDRSRLDADRASWWVPLVNHVLATMDGGGIDLTGVVLVAATNAIDKVDPALLRPGRFGTWLAIPPPDLDALASALVYHLGGDACPIPKAGLVELLRPLVGVTPARAASWARDALERARRETREVRFDDVAAVVLPPDGRPEWQRRLIAVHEAGHAVAGLRLCRERLVSASIVATATTGGATRFLGYQEALLSRTQIEDNVVVLLAGRAAEVVVGQWASAGAGAVGDVENISDLAQATSRLAAVHGCYGLGQTLRHRGDVTRPEIMRHDRELTRSVEADLQRLMARAERLIVEHTGAVRAVAEALLSNAFLGADEIASIVQAAQEQPLGPAAPYTESTGDQVENDSVSTSNPSMVVPCSSMYPSTLPRIDEDF